MVLQPPLVRYGAVLLCCRPSTVFLTLFSVPHQRNDYTIEAVSDGFTAMIKPLKNDFSFL